MLPVYINPLNSKKKKRKKKKYFYFYIFISAFYFWWFHAYTQCSVILFNPCSHLFSPSYSCWPSSSSQTVPLLLSCLPLSVDLYVCVRVYVCECKSYLAQVGTATLCSWLLQPIHVHKTAFCIIPPMHQLIRSFFLFFHVIHWALEQML